MSNGQVVGGCDEPCRWHMRKVGYGNPPWLDAEDLCQQIELLIKRKAT